MQLAFEINLSLARHDAGHPGERSFIQKDLR